MAKKKEEPKAPPRKLGPPCESHAGCIDVEINGCGVHVPCGRPTTHVAIVASDSPLKPARMLSCAQHSRTFGGYDILTVEELATIESAYSGIHWEVRTFVTKLLATIVLDVEQPDPEAMEPFERATTFARKNEEVALQANDFFCHPCNPLRYYGHPVAEYRYVAHRITESLLPF